MLDRVRLRAERAGLGGRVETRLAAADSLGAVDLAGSLDLILNFWMLHEVPDQAGFLAQVKRLLKPEGVLFIAEPPMHVTAAEFEASLEKAAGVGLGVVERPRVRMARAAVLRAG